MEGKHIKTHKGISETRLFVLAVVLIALAVGAGFWWGAKERNSTDNPPANGGDQPSGVSVMNDFGTKLVYTTDVSKDPAPYEAHCAEQGGTFNTCGTTCEPDAFACAQVCAYTCDDIGGAGDEVFETTKGNTDIIMLETPLSGDVVESPLVVRGAARGQWYFEASFPIILTDWDGRIIAEHFATAQGEWMTTDYVPFEAEVSFESPYTPGDPDFMKRGSLILQKDNPSGLPENDDALEISVRFAQ